MRYFAQIFQVKKENNHSKIRWGFFTKFYWPEDEKNSFMLNAASHFRRNSHFKKVKFCIFWAFLVENGAFTSHSSNLVMQIITWEKKKDTEKEIKVNIAFFREFSFWKENREREELHGVKHRKSLVSILLQKITSRFH